MVNINLLPAQYRRSSEPNAWRYATFALPVVAGVAVLTLSLLQGQRLGAIASELDATNGQITALQPAKTEYDALKREKTELEQVTEVSRALQASKTYWSTDLARFVNALPTGQKVALTSLNMTAVDSNAQTNLTQTGAYDGKAVSKQFELAGQASSTEALISFLNTFEVNPDFGVNFRGAQLSAPSGPASAPGAGAPSAGGSQYTFTASVGLVAPVTAAAEGAGAGTPPAGASTGALPGAADGGTN